MRALLRRLRYLLRRSQFDADLAEEMEFHHEMKERELARQGDSARDTSVAARRALGNIALARNQARDVWVWPSVDEFVHDLRFAARALYRDRGFSLAAIAMLTLAVALNASMFTIMDAMLFRGYPLVKGNDRLLYLQERFPSGRCCIVYPDFEAWRTQSHAFEAMAFIGEQLVTFRDSHGRPADMLAFTISPNTFRLLGVQPVLGRDFVASDESPGAAPVAMLNYRFWASRFGRRADVVGTTVHINGVPTVVVGVMPEGFDFPTRENVWMPLVRTARLQQRSVIQFMAVGRLRGGITSREARADLEAINHRLETDYPGTNHGVEPVLHTFSEAVSGPDAAVIWGSLWVGSWFVLLVACANVANLSLVRTSRRWREFATRMALGAGQARMVRHIALEMLMLAVAAGVLACLMTTWSVGAWAVATASRYQVLNYSVDAGTFGYVLAVTIVAALLGSVPSIVRLAHFREGTALRGDGRGLTQGASGKHLAKALVAGQMALAIVLLSGSGVLVRSLLTIVHADTGVRDPEHVLVGAIRLPSDQYSTADARLAYFDRLRAEVTAIPGVQLASLGSTLPVGSVNVWPIEIEGRPISTESEDAVQFLTIAPQYFRVLGASAIVGRDFNDGDHVGTLPVAIVNRAFVERFWPGEQPIGRHLRVATGTAPRGWLTVIGVAPNIMQGDAIRQHFKPLVYVSFRQQPSTRVFLFARTAIPPDGVVQAVRAAAQALEPDAIVDDPTTLKARFAFDRDFMDPEHSELGKHAAVAPAFAAIALILAALGLYAVITHSVTQRTKEIGVRIAIGASAQHVRRMVLREGMAPVAIGVVLGLIASLMVNRILQSQLVGVSPYDAATMAGAPVMLLVIALIACYLPARRAVSVDPVVALLHE